MCFAWTKAVLCVYDGAIVNSQPFEREKIRGIICGLCGGGVLYPGPRVVLERAVKTTITDSGRPIKSAYSPRDSGSIDRRHARATTATSTTWRS